MFLYHVPATWYFAYPLMERRNIVSSTCVLLIVINWKRPHQQLQNDQGFWTKTSCSTHMFWHSSKIKIKFFWKLSIVEEQLFTDRDIWRYMEEQLFTDRDVP